MEKLQAAEAVTKTQTVTGSEFYDGALVATWCIAAVVAAFFVVRELTRPSEGGYGNC